MQTDLPELVVPAINKCGMEARSAAAGFPDTSFPSANRRGASMVLKVVLWMISSSETMAICWLGTSIPTYPLPGTGAWMRIRDAFKAMAMSSAKRTILLTRTRVRPLRDSMKSGSTPKSVIEGPRLISTTWAGVLKDRRVSSITRARCWSFSSSTLTLTMGASISSGWGSIQVFLGLFSICVTAGFAKFATGSGCLGWVTLFSKTILSGWAVLRICSCLCPAWKRFCRDLARSTNLCWSVLSFLPVQTDRSDIDRSKSRIRLVSSQADMAIIAPGLPSQWINKSRIQRPRVPPPRLTVPLTNLEREISSNHSSKFTKPRISPKTLSNETMGNFSILRINSHKPKTIKSTGRAYPPSPIALVSVAVHQPVSIPVRAVKKLSSVKIPKSISPMPKISSFLSGEIWMCGLAWLVFLGAERVLAARVVLRGVGLLLFLVVVFFWLVVLRLAGLAIAPPNTQKFYNRIIA